MSSGASGLLSGGGLEWEESAMGSVDLVKLLT